MHRQMTARRVRAVIQTGATECGVSCAVALLGYFGRHESVDTVRADLDPGRDGSGAKDIARVLTSRGMEVAVVRASSAEAIRGFTVPVVVHWQGHHFVVVERASDTWVWIMDPAKGRRRIATTEFVESFTDIVIVASPTDDFERQRIRPWAPWAGVFRLPERSLRRIAAVLLLSLAVYGGLLVTPAIARRIIDAPQTLAAPGASSVWLPLVLLLFVLQVIIYHLRVRVVSSLTAAFGVDLMCQVFTRLLRLPYRYFTARQPGEIMYRLSSVSQVRDTVVRILSGAALDVGAFLVLSTYLVITAPLLAAIALTFMVATGVVSKACRPAVTRAVDDEIQSGSEATTMQFDAVVSIPSIRLGGYRDVFVREWRAAFSKAMTAMRRRVVVQDGRQGALGSAIGSYGGLIILVVGVQLSTRGQGTMGEAVAAQMVATAVFGLTSSLVSTYNDVMATSTYLERINEIRCGAEEANPGVRTGGPMTIALREVTFAYSSSARPSISGVDLSIDEGTHVAIVGPSGSGKSSVAKIIATLYQPGSGQMLVAGAPVSEYDLDALRARIGYIPQEAHLHNRTLLENLTLGQDVSQKRIREVLCGVGLDEVIESLPMGLDTVVTELGGNFSGGQRQRIVIARTLLQSPQLLILDEATASLDTASEARIHDFVARQGLTQVTISHRLGTALRSDRIYVMARGRVVGSGRHATLLEECAPYRELWESGKGADTVAGSADLVRAGVA